MLRCFITIEGRERKSRWRERGRLQITGREHYSRQSGPNRLGHQLY